MTLIRSSLGLLSFLLLSTALASASQVNGDESAQSHVHILTNDNFATVIDPHPLSLVKFYAPWCGHCKAMAEDYEKAATTLAPNDIRLGEVNCDEERDLCNKFGVRGFPTLKVFRSGKPSDYEGGRSEDTIVQYMQRQALPALTDLVANDIAEFSKKDRVVIVIYLPDGKEDSSYNVIDSLSQALRTEYMFGFTSDKEAAKILEVDVIKPALILYRSFDEPKVQYDGESLTESDLTAFIRRESIPTMDEISPETYSDYIKTGLPMAFFFYDSSEMRSKYGPGLEAVAGKYKKDVRFVYCDANKFGAHAETMALKVGEWPAFGIHEAAGDRKFPFDQSKEPTEEEVAKFVAKYVNKEIEPTFKSQEVPTEQPNAVIDVVGLSFKDVVLDTSKDVFIKFYAPWCGHCKKLAPIWDELATSLESQKDKLIIAKMDLTQNDLPSEGGDSVGGYPTLRLYRAEDNKAIEYTGTRDFDDLLSFVSKNVKNAITLPEPAKKEEVDTDLNQQKPDHEEL